MINITIGEKLKILKMIAGGCTFLNYLEKDLFYLLKDEVLIFKKPTTYSRPIYKIGKLEVAVNKRVFFELVQRQE